MHFMSNVKENISHQGLYEQLINKLISSKLKNIDRTIFYVKEVPIDKTEAFSLFL